MATLQDFINSAVAGFIAVATQRNTDIPPLQALARAADEKAEAALDIKQDKQFTASLTGAVSRLLSSKSEDVISIKDFGAACDGVADDTAAVQAAVAAIPNNTRGASIYFPGPTRITERITMSFPSKTVCLYGNGVNSDILCDGRYAGIEWISTIDSDGIATTPQFMMSGLWITKTYEPSAGQSGETGLRLVWSSTGVVAGTDHLRLSNGGIRAASGAAFWSQALEIVDGGAAVFTGFTFSNFNGVDLTRTETAIKLIREKALNCCRFQFSGCYIFRFTRGIKVIQAGAIQVGSIEAIYWTGGELVGVGIGFESDAPGGYPTGNALSQFQFVNSHMDASVGFVKAPAINNLYVTNNFLIKSNNGATPGDSPGFDIPGGVTGGAITDNNIHQFDKTYGTGVSDAIDVSSTGISLGLFVKGNLFSNWRRGVNVGVANSFGEIRVASDNTYSNCDTSVFAPDEATRSVTMGAAARHTIDGAFSSELVLRDGGAPSGLQSFGLYYDGGKLYQRRLSNDATTTTSAYRVDLLEASISWNALNTPHGGQNFVDIALTGAEIGDYVQVSASGPLQNAFVTGEVNVNDSVRVYLHNMSGADVDLGTLTYFVRVHKRA